jgi:2-oxoglutarate ferredoxin oxidoreductase subunit delta
MAVSKEDLMVHIKEEWCKGCGICIAYCPKKVLGFNEHGKVSMLDRDNCIKCGMCEMRCPDFAIFLGGKENV